MKLLYRITKVLAIAEAAIAEVPSIITIQLVAVLAVASHKFYIVMH